MTTEYQKAPSGYASARGQNAQGQKTQLNTYVWLVPSSLGVHHSKHVVMDKDPLPLLHLYLHAPGEKPKPWTYRGVHLSPQRNSLNTHFGSNSRPGVKG